MILNERLFPDVGNSMTNNRHVLTQNFFGKFFYRYIKWLANN